METILENKDYSDSDLLEIAKSSQDSTILDELKYNCNSKIRRAVARNEYTSSKTLDYLLMDSVQNVSYMVMQNKNCPTRREFGNVTNPCVLCLEDERYRNCDNCKIIQKYHEDIVD
jgi:hypothetical protein